MKSKQPPAKKTKTKKERATEKETGIKRTARLPIVVSNRRREWRFDLPLRAVVEGKLPQGDLFREATVIENISSGGAYFGLNSRVVVGSKLNLMINLPEKLTEGRKMSLVIAGTAVRLEKPEKRRKKQGVAVRFSRNFKFVAVDKNKASH